MEAFTRRRYVQRLLVLCSRPQGFGVWVHYVGRLRNGTVFDSSRGRGQPLEFKLGVGQLISAYDIGVKTMRQGELAHHVPF